MRHPRVTIARLLPLVAYSRTEAAAFPRDARFDSRGDSKRDRPAAVGAGRGERDGGELRSQLLGLLDHALERGAVLCNESSDERSHSSAGGSSAGGGVERLPLRNRQPQRERAPT